MKAIVQDRFGPPEVLRLADIDLPEIGPGDVLVRVRAAGLNPYDWHMLRGDPLIVRLIPGATGLTRPKNRVAGLDAAGVVEAAGADVRGLSAGDEVLGFCPGAFAEYARAEAGKVVPKPPGLTFDQAAAIPIAATTALRGIREIGQVRAGHQVLVNGAAGGVGSFAVQIATALGAEVTGVCSTRNAELVRSLGAAHVIDYTTDDFTGEPAPLRRDPGQRGQPAAAPAAQGADPGRDPRAQRRRLARPCGRAPRRHGPGSAGQTGSSASAFGSCLPGRTGLNWPPSPRSPKTASSRRSWTGRTRWLTLQRACATWSKGTPAARSSSPWREGALA